MREFSLVKQGALAREYESQCHCLADTEYFILSRDDREQVLFFGFSSKNRLRWACGC